MVFAVGLLFGYTLTYIVFSSLYSQSDSSQNTVQYFVPPAPHSHGEMNQHLPALSDVQQWHDFHESSHISMCTFYFHSLFFNPFSPKPLSLSYLH